MPVINSNSTILNNPAESDLAGYEVTTSGTPEDTPRWLYAHLSARIVHSVVCKPCRDVLRAGHRAMASGDPRVARVRRLAVSGRHLGNKAQRQEKGGHRSL